MAEIKFSIDEFAQPDDMAGSDFAAPPIGRWHCIVVESKDTESGVELWFDILTPGPQKGKRITQRLTFPNGRDAQKDKLYSKRLGAWFFRLGVITQEKWDENKRTGEPLVFNTDDSVLRQCILEVVPHSYVSGKTGKTIDTAQVGYMGIFPLSHPDVQDVEIDSASAALEGYVRAPGGGPSPFVDIPQASSASSASSAVAPVTVPADAFDI